MRYSTEAKVFALDLRRRGRTWKEVQQAVNDAFSVKAPSLRALQKWEKEFDPDAVARVMKSHPEIRIPWMDKSALQRVAEEMLSVLWQAEEADEDVELHGWLYFLSIVERHLGSDRFWRLLSEYDRWPKMVGAQISRLARAANRAAGAEPSTAKARGADGITQFGFAFLLGVAADTAVHVGARTLDLSWQPGIIPIAIVVLLAGGLFAALRVRASETDPQAASDGSWGRGLALVALGPWLFLQLQAYQNVARVSALTGWETPALAP